MQAERPGATLAGMTRTAAETRGGTSVLVAGGGVAALETALALRALGPGRIRVELVAPELHFFYRPLAVAEPFESAASTGGSSTTSFAPRERTSSRASSWPSIPTRASPS